MQSPNWQRFRNAPPIGTKLCHLDEVPRDSMLKVTFGEAPQVFPVLLIRHREGLHAYVDLCPHQWLPLTFKGDNVLADQGREIVCSNHQARFKTADGQPLSGPVTPGCGLTSVPVAVDESGVVRIGK